jgi:hypothetical protein
MGLSPKEMHARIIENLGSKTGRDLSEWLKIAESLDQSSTEKERIARLKKDWDLGHYTAVAIVKELTTGNEYNDDKRLIDALFKPGTEARSVYGSVDQWLCSQENVERVPCKTYVGYRAHRQFAVVRPGKNSTLEVGLTLPPDQSSSLALSKGFGSARIQSKFLMNSPEISEQDRALLTAAIADAV